MSLALRVATRWQIQAALFEPPPAVYKAVQGAVLKIYASHIWGLITPVLEAYRLPGRKRDERFVSLLRLEQLLKQYASKPKSRKTQTSVEIPVDLTGWKYLTPEEVSKRLEPITVVIRFVPLKKYVGRWYADSRKLEVTILAAKPISPEEFLHTWDWIDSTIEHEVRHAGQTFLQELRGLKKPGGLPSPELQTPEHRPSGGPVDWRKKPLEHALRDIEFYTNLGSAIRHFKRDLRKIPLPLQDAAFRKFVGLPYDAGKERLLGTYAPMLTLREKDPDKWRKAVGEFYKAVF